MTTAIAPSILSSSSAYSPHAEPTPRTTISPNLLNQFYQGHFVKHENRFVQIAQIKERSIVVKHKEIAAAVDAENPNQKITKSVFAEASLHSFCSELLPDDLVLAYDPHENVHFAGRVISIEESDININIFDKAGNEVPYYIPREFNSPLNIFERIIPILGINKQNLLKQLPQRDLELEVFEDEDPFVVSAYYLT